MEGEGPIGSILEVIIAVIGDEISIISCNKHGIPINDQRYDQAYNKRLVINNKTSKEDIIKYIKDKFKKNENPEQTGNTPVDQTRGTNRIITKSPSKKPATNMRYIEYKPDKAYKGIKDYPNKYTANDVMIYLSEIRKNNEMTAPDYLKSAHDALYNAIETRVKEQDINNITWMGLDIIMDKNTTINANKLFEIIYYIEKSKTHVRYDSYKTVKTKLDSAFDKILNNESNNVPNVYLEALKQMKSAISSFTTFKYNNDIIFEFDYMYDNSGFYYRLKHLTEYLNNTIFDRFGVQTPDDKKKYPPSILKLNIALKNSNRSGEEKCNITTTSSLTRDDSCFDIFLSTNKDEVVRFLKYISSKPEKTTQQNAKTTANISQSPTTTTENSKNKIASLGDNGNGELAHESDDDVTTTELGNDNEQQVASKDALRRARVLKLAAERKKRDKSNSNRKAEKETQSPPSPKKPSVTEESKDNATSPLNPTPTQNRSYLSRMGNMFNKNKNN
jgi:hypothetical protein